jgi:hypothetical protein
VHYDKHEKKKTKETTEEAGRCKSTGLSNSKRIDQIDYSPPISGSSFFGA